MAGSKVVYLDEYRKKRANRQKSLCELIEGHLAEAGLLEKMICRGKRQKSSGGSTREKSPQDAPAGEDAG